MNYYLYHFLLLILTYSLSSFIIFVYILVQLFRSGRNHIFLLSFVASSLALDLNSILATKAGFLDLPKYFLLVGVFLSRIWLNCWRCLHHGVVFCEMGFWNYIQLAHSNRQRFHSIDANFGNSSFYFRCLFVLLRHSPLNSNFALMN